MLYAPDFFTSILETSVPGPLPDATPNTKQWILWYFLSNSLPPRSTMSSPQAENSQIDIPAPHFSPKLDQVSNSSWDIFLGGSQDKYLKLKVFLNRIHLLPQFLLFCYTVIIITTSNALKRLQSSRHYFNAYTRISLTIPWDNCRKRYYHYSLSINYEVEAQRN